MCEETEYTVDINDLTVTFGTHTALKNLNLKIKCGSFVSVVGPNGGGKSTLLRVILGLINDYQGTVSICNQIPNKIPAEWIGYVPQIKTLDRTFPAKSFELVATGIKGSWVGKVSKEEMGLINNALEKVSSLHLANRQLSKLSGGELQRVYLARSIVRNPKILLLDEPATGVDAGGEHDINAHIDQYRKTSNATIIMVTHDWESAFHHADYVAMLNRSLICYEVPKIAFNEACLRKTFGHVGHSHEMMFGVKEHV